MSSQTTHNEDKATLKTQVVVIGSGSGGLVAAIGLAKAGYKVIIIEKNKIGGDCTHYGCVPSKALLHKTREYSDFKKQFEELISEIPNTLKGDPSSISELLNKKAVGALHYAREVVHGFADEESPEWLESFKIDLIFANASFSGSQRVKCDLISDRLFSTALGKTFQDNVRMLEIEFDFCVIATGSRPLIPSIKGLDTVPYLTNETIFDLDSPPKKLAIIGNGPIGIEMAQAFSDLGSEIVVFGKGGRILQRSDSDHSLILQKILAKKGVTFEFGNVEEVKNDQGSFTILANNTFQEGFTHILIATGRSPSTNLKLEEAGIQYSDKGININRQCLTSNTNIYAIGDCCPVPRFTHMADHMGQTVVTNLIIRKYLKLPIPVAKYPNPDFIPAVTFTHPEIAQAGYTEDEARKKYGSDSIRVVRFLINNSDRAKTQREEVGEVKLIVKGLLGRFIGVHIIGSRAGEMLPEFQRLILEKKNMLSIGSIVRAYPTYSSRMGSVALGFFLSRLPSSKKNRK